MLAGDHGVALTFHPHVGTAVEFEAQIDRLLADTDVDLCFDTGHHAFWDQDPLAYMDRVRDRIGYMHLKNVERRHLRPRPRRQPRHRRVLRPGRHVPAPRRRRRHPRRHALAPRRGLRRPGRRRAGPRRDRHARRLPSSPAATSTTSPRSPEEAAAHDRFHRPDRPRRSRPAHAPAAPRRRPALRHRRGDRRLAEPDRTDRPPLRRPPARRRGRSCWPTRPSTPFSSSRPTTCMRRCSARPSPPAKHVFIEKPVCLTLAELEPLIEREPRQPEGGLRRLHAPLLAPLPRAQAPDARPRRHPPRPGSRHHPRGAVLPAARPARSCAATTSRPRSSPRRAAAPPRSSPRVTGADAPADVRRAYQVLTGLSSHSFSAMRELLGPPAGVIAARQHGGETVIALFDYGHFTAVYEAVIGDVAEFDCRHRRADLGPALPPDLRHPLYPPPADAAHDHHLRRRPRPAPRSSARSTRIRSASSSTPSTTPSPSAARTRRRSRTRSPTSASSPRSRNGFREPVIRLPRSSVKSARRGATVGTRRESPAHRKGGLE